MAEKASTEAISAASSRLDCPPRAEQAGTAEIHDQHQGQFALLDEFFDERMVHARGDVPINGADVIAGLVFPDLVEIHALALEDAVVLPRRAFRSRAGWCESRSGGFS
jgi:hypothetical protein